MVKRAVVVGATSGIGEQVARILANDGWLVGIAGRRLERLVDIEASEKGIVCHRQIDVVADNAVDELYGLIDELGGMDLYFHSSGIGWQNDKLDEKKELLTVNTNAVGFVKMVDAAFNWFISYLTSYSYEPYSIKPYFRIACITSIAGTKGLGAAPAYSATKRMQSHYLECLSQLARMRGLPISLTDIRPGFVATDLISGCRYPMQMSPDTVARHIVRAIKCDREVVTIDWRYSVLVLLWRLVPRWLWVRLNISSK